MPTETIQGFRLSPQQEHLWLLQQVDQSPAYRAQCAVLIEGNLDTKTLTAALKAVVNRHEILRTTFHCLPGMDLPLQVISARSIPSVHKHNLSGLILQEQEVKSEALFHELSQLPFDFEQGPLLHIALAELSDDKHMLFVSLPAFYGDTVTLKNLVCEISDSYAACLHGAQLSDEPMQYADISEIFNQLIESEETKAGKEYWGQMDLSELFGLKLISENRQAVEPGFAPKFLTSAIHRELAAKIEAIAHKYDTSTSVFLLACWQILLWRLTEQSDIIIGTACDGRNYEGLDSALGLFAKYLPLNCHLEENLQFSEVLEQVNDLTRKNSKWQEYFTWEQIVEAAGNGIRYSFFPFCFEFEQQPANYSAAGLSLSIYKQYAYIDRFKVKLSCLCRDNSLSAEFHYDSNLFQPEEIKRLARQFQALLESIANTPEALISELEILSDRERQQLLVEFNNTKSTYPNNKCIHQLFEEQVERTPDNTAVVFADQQLTYAELNGRANQLAHHLQQQGVGPEVLVGICVERSLEMLIGILGILKAGGAYIPLDPAYPQERLAFMLEDAQTPVLLTQQRLVKSLPEHRAIVICLDTDWEAIAQESQENPASGMTADNLVYVIYTSGSTGKPKGVQIAHRNLVHSTIARIVYYQEPVTSFLLLSSFAFDSSVAGIFWTLCQGGILYLPQEGLQREVPKIIDLIAQNQVSHLLSLPSLYALLLQQAKPEQLVSLRTVIVAGEPCPRELVGHHLDIRSETSLFNEYGPTEATVWSSVHHCRSQFLRAQVSIGRPIANTQIYVLDSHLHPVPVGVVGELYISGDGLARGYLNQPELTAAKFIPNPFVESHEPGARLYKTGDLARYQSDGSIEFLGRIDYQVKIRGYRIELGEIEAVLKQHPGVREAVVVTRDQSEGHSQQNTQRVGGSIGQEDTEVLVTQMELSLGQEGAEQLLAELEKLSEDETEELLTYEMPSNLAEEKSLLQRIRRFPEFDISLRIKEDKFINPPREYQKNWIINQALDEFAADLMYLDQISKRFVPGARTQSPNELSQSEVISDRSQSMLEDQQIMEDWQIPLMKAMANVVTETHGHVLEVGFGRGISSNFIQERGVKSHTIIECNDYIVEDFYKWKNSYPDKDIKLVHGKWQDVAEQLGMYDGIFFHTHILNEDELVEFVSKSITFAEPFFPTAAAHLRKGGIFTYLTHEIDSFSRRHQRLVFKYFSSLTLSVVESLPLPKDCKDLWWADSMVVVKCIK